MKKIILLFSVLPTLVLAGGFQLNVQGVKGVGLGGAFTGYGIDASSVFFNPGAIGNIKNHQFILGTHLITPSVSLQTDIHSNINQTTGNATPLHFYYAGKINKKLGVGFLINNQFGSSSSFEDDWQGRFIVQNISLKTFMFQPTLSYQLHEKIGVGAGFVFSTGIFSYEKGVPVSSASTQEGKAILSGKGTGVGFNVGVFSNIHSSENHSFSLGINYRSGTEIKLPSGTAEFVDIPSSLSDKFPTSTSFESSLNLPSVLTIGISYVYKKPENFNVAFLYDYNLTNWSSYDTLSFDFENEDTPDSKTTKDWKNASTHRFGIDFIYKEKTSLRAGLYIDQSPIKDGYVSPELPDADQTAFTAGIGYKVNESFQIDASYIRQSSERESALLDAGFSAKYNRKVNVYGISLTYNLPQKTQSSSSID